MLPKEIFSVKLGSSENNIFMLKDILNEIKVHYRINTKQFHVASGKNEVAKV
jgi:hypothetical protein